jgi:hypothetical protein
MILGNQLAEAKAAGPHATCTSPVKTSWV